MNEGLILSDAIDLADDDDDDDAIDGYAEELSYVVVPCAYR